MAPCRHATTFVAAAIAGFLALGFLKSAPAPDPSPQELYKKATVEGKYRMLLCQFRVEEDRDDYDDFCDFGYRAKKEYGKESNLPSGWWVYVHPYWYIWRDRTAKPQEKRAWGPEQATGEPDTPNAGDMQTAWASKTPDGDDEWLLVEYAEPVIPKTISVYETFNPGALNRVTVFKLDGSEVEVWKGDDPTAPNSVSGVSEISVKIDFKVARVKLYLNSKAVAGWNEIDAVGIKDDQDRTLWAVAAEASSTYAPPRQVQEEVSEQYEEQLGKLRADIKRLRDTLKKDKVKAAEEIKKLEDQRKELIDRIKLLNEGKK